MESPKDVVLSFINALNEENFETAKSYLNPTFNFNGPMGTRENADIYIEDMKKMKFKYEVEKTFENDDDEVCLIYNINMGRGEPIKTCGIYHLENSKLSSLKALFDPRPILK
jgi:limonene-1,2-epoxide hydrolase